MVFKRNTAGLGTLILLLSGCNLAFDLDAFPYESPAKIIDLGDVDANNSNNINNINNINNVNNVNNSNNIPDMSPDIPVGEPKLVITEVLINTSAMNPEISTGELGEYVEIKNIGDGAADPRHVSFRLSNVDTGADGQITVALPTTSDQVAVYQGLKPIEPGDYFVFVRHIVADLPLAQVIEPGRYYDYGRWGEGDSLANSSERLLELQYFDGTTLHKFDSVRWASGSLQPTDGSDSPTLTILEDEALSVREGFETVDGNDSPNTWCGESQRVGTGSFMGTPGEAPACP